MGWNEWSMAVAYIPIPHLISPMLSKKAKYAIKALLALAGQREEPVRISDLARAEQIPRKFLELILLVLKNQGVLQSRKGKGGGYLLARDPSTIYLGQIVRMFDGPLAPVPCASQTAYVRCADCRDEAACGVHLAMKEVRDAMARVLDGTTLAALRSQVQHAQGAGIAG
jgi:Rrf2 family protein